MQEWACFVARSSVVANRVWQFRSFHDACRLTSLYGRNTTDNWFIGDHKTCLTLKKSLLPGDTAAKQQTKRTDCTPILHS